MIVLAMMMRDYELRRGSKLRLRLKTTVNDVFLNAGKKYDHHW